MAIEPREIGVERDETGYDKVWSNKAYVEQYGRMHMDYYNRLIDFLKNSHIMEGAISVADIGCGPGNLISMIAKNWPDKNLYGFDFSTNALNIARGKVKNVTFQRHDIYEPFSARFDTVLCCETLEHLLYPAKALGNVLDATQKICVLTVPDGRIDTYSGHINFWSEESWSCFLEVWDQSWDIITQRIGFKLSAIMSRRN
jgi:SAM-dependent methyltransferase